MLLVFQQVFILFALTAVGYGLAKGRVIKAEQTNILTGLLVYVFCTCNSFKTFATDFNSAYLKNNYKIILVSIGVLVILSVIMHFVSKLFAKDRYSRYIYEYSLIMPNFGYMGYGLAELLLGASGLLSVMVFGMPMLIYIYIIGFSMLTKRPVSFKGLVNVMTVTMVLGMAVGLLEIKLPEMIISALDISRACMLPTSMLLMGIVISRFQFRKILHNPRIYIVTILRLVIIPVGVGAVLKMFFPLSIVRPAVIALAMPCGLNTVVFPDLVGEDCSIGAGLALLSGILSCVSVPIVFAMFGIGVSV